MRLLIIRHGIAEEREVWARTGNTDDERPLTKEGRRKMARNARGIRRAVESIDLLVTSPLTRARQTAQIVADAFKLEPIETTPALVPGTPLIEFAEWLRAHAGSHLIAAVGHEPHLSTLITWLISGVEDSRMELKKGAAVLLEIAGHVDPGSARLIWSIPPSQLRALA